MTLSALWFLLPNLNPELADGAIEVLLCLYLDDAPPPLPNEVFLEIRAEAVEVDMVDGARDALLAPLFPPALLAVSDPSIDITLFRRPGSMADIPCPPCEPYLIGVDERWR
jgi:hypothetical protein